VARECFARNWQHGRLWINDPDCLLLSNRPEGRPLSADELRFHASAVLASGGMVLAGVDMTAADATAWEALRRLVPPSGVAARFGGPGGGAAAGDLLEGTVELPGRRLVCLFNRSERPLPARLRIPAGGAGAVRVADFWDGARFDSPPGAAVVDAGTVPPHGARVLECVRDDSG
jgi:alpha-galactosidase